MLLHGHACLIAMGLAAGLTPLIAEISLGTTAAVLGGLLVLEMMLFGCLDPQSRVVTCQS
eukprot:m.1433643 g.1433643  ORF g.1433643 m.1433643 type:complete len:60 (-) comp25080_c0_seq19:4429-4608(-)